MVTSDHMKAEASRCLVEWKSYSFPGCNRGTQQRGHDKGLLRTMGSQLGTRGCHQLLFAVCFWGLWGVDLLHIRNANISKQGEAFSCHSGGYWTARSRGDTRINKFPHLKLFWDTRLLWGRKSLYINWSVAPWVRWLQGSISGESLDKSRISAAWTNPVG